MKFGKWLQKGNMTSLKIKAPFLEAEWSPAKSDQDAAWALYIELLTRIATQPLNDKHGDEKTALNSIFSLFVITREVIKSHGRGCIQFAKLAVIVLNQIIRPFTAKWHSISIKDGFSDDEVCRQFRTELVQLQDLLCTYTRMLADMAGVEDLTEFEDR